MARLAVLITLLAVLGPVACQGASICFNGWLRLPGLCPRGSGPRVFSRQRRPPPSAPWLSYGYYNNRGSASYCPRAEGIVRSSVKKAVDQNPGIGAGLIRLFFHDCFVRGCDGSVLLKTTATGNADTEREGPPNKDSLRGFEVIDEAKAAIEAACPGVVSCADVVAFAARDASTILSNGNINIRVPAGRYDGRESFANETDQLPGPFSNLTQLQGSFVDGKGLSVDEMVTLSGAHSIGRARCRFFSDRLADMDPALAARLRAQCNGNGNTNVNQDDATPNVLDGQYYKNVIDKKVLFESDAVLNSAETRMQVTQNANGRGVWERKFESAMENMGKIGVKPRTQTGAEIRKVCWKVNN